MAGSSRQHRGEKRRKELARKERQEVKRQRRAERKAGGAGSGPPIDWEAAAAGSPPAQETSPPSNPGNAPDTKPS
jgi:hypothetical protein